jgi:hypothetical protein
MNPKSVRTLVVVMLISACAPIQVGRPEEVAIQPAISSSPTSVATAAELPPAWTPTQTNVPTSTPTITFTPTITLTPTTISSATPKPTKIEDPKLAVLEDVKLFLSDLPAGYTDVPLDESEIDSISMQEDGLTLLSWSAFTNEAAMSSVMSILGFFDSPEYQEEFDRSIEDAAQEMAQAGAGFDLSELGINLELEVIEDFPLIADNSVAVRMTLQIEDETAPISNAAYEIAMFRRGNIAGVILITVFSDSAQNPDLEDLTILLDNRLVAALEN